MSAMWAGQKTAGDAPAGAPAAAGAESARTRGSARLLDDLREALHRAQRTEDAVAAGFASDDAMASVSELVLRDMKEILRRWTADGTLAFAAPACAAPPASPLQAHDAGDPCEQLLSRAQSALLHVHSELQSAAQQGLCTAAFLELVNPSLEAVAARLTELDSQCLASAADARLACNQRDEARGHVQDVLGRIADQRKKLLGERRKVREKQLELMRQRAIHDEALRTEVQQRSTLLQEQMAVYKSLHEREKASLQREVDVQLAAVQRLGGHNISHYDVRELKTLEDELKQACDRVEQIALLREAEGKVAKVMESLRCPISLSLMRDPVQTADGITYEREEIEKWLRDSDISPKTLLPLPHKTLVVNYAIKGCIEEAVQAKLKQLAVKKDDRRLAEAKRPRRV